MTDNNQDDDVVLQLMRSATRLGIKFEISTPAELLKMQRQIFGDESNTPHLFDLQGYYHIGSTIHEMGSPTMGELAKKLDVPLSTTTRMVTWLVDNEYVHRIVDETDRRIVRIALADKGMQVYEVATQFFAQIIKHNLSVLTEEERAILFTLLHKIVRGLLNQE